MNPLQNIDGPNGSLLGGGRRSKDSRRVLVVVGTRPEAIKLAPVILALREAEGWTPLLVTTGQHGAVVNEVLATFGTPADIPLAPWERNGDLAGLHTALMPRLAATVERFHPDAVIVQGDTATTLAGALTAFWAHVPVVHLEAGLRSGDLAAPFPEEANRRMVAQIAAFHLPPTVGAASALLAEGVDPASMLVVGNTVVDAVRWLAANSPTSGNAERIGATSDHPLLLVTCHRRENWGAGTRRIATSLRALVAEHPTLDVVVAAHPNPAVRAVLDTELDGMATVSVRDAVPYDEFISLLDRSRLVLTDSGGVQEEAAALGVPALVLREVTERREGIDAGLAELVGTAPDVITAGARRILGRPMPTRRTWTSCPYGDGNASRRTVQSLAFLLDGAALPAPFLFYRGHHDPRTSGMHRTSGTPMHSVNAEDITETHAWANPGFDAANSVIESRNTDPDPPREPTTRDGPDPETRPEFGREVSGR